MTFKGLFQPKLFYDSMKNASVFIQQHIRIRKVKKNRKYAIKKLTEIYS